MRQTGARATIHVLIIMAFAACVVPAATAKSKKDPLADVPIHPHRTLNLAGDFREVLFPDSQTAVVLQTVPGDKRATRATAFRIPGGDSLWSAQMNIGLDADGRSIWAQDSTGVLVIGEGPVSAVDLHTGAILWTLQKDDTHSLLKMLFPASGLFLVAEDRTARVEPRTGKILWVLEKADTHKVTDSILDLDRLLLVADDQVACVALESGEIAWSYKCRHVDTVFRVDATMVPPENLPYGISSVVTSDDQKWLDNKTGRELDPDGLARFRSLQAASGRIVPYLAESRVQALAANGDLLWKSAKKYRDRAIFVGYTDSAAIVCDPGDKRVLPNPAFAVSSEEVAQNWDTHSFFLDDYTVDMLSLRDGKVVASFAGKNLWQPPLLDHGDLIIMDEKEMKCLDGETGKQIGTFASRRHPDQTMLPEHRLLEINRHWLRVVDFPRDSCTLTPTVDWSESKQTHTTMIVLDSTAVCATAEQGILDVSLNRDETTNWRIPTGEDPSPLFSPDKKILLVLDGRQVHVAAVR